MVICYMIATYEAFKKSYSHLWLHLVDSSFVSVFILLFSTYVLKILALFKSSPELTKNMNNVLEGFLS